MKNKIIGSFTFHDECDLLVFQLEMYSYLCDELIIQGDCPTERAREIAKSYVDNKKIFYIENTKQNKFSERDEYGDRQRLLNFAKSRNGNIHLHTDTDELFALKNLNQINDILQGCRDNEIYEFARYDFWGNAYNYRIPYNTTINAGKEISNFKPPGKTTYIYSLKYAQNFSSMPLPNFHSPRTPSFSAHMNTIFRDDISVYHMGYYLQSIIDKKQTFYLTDINSSGNCWGKDMQVSRDTFLNTWGMGAINRK